jgi:hypothetical protein
LALLNQQIKARFIVHQLMEGVPYNQLRLTIELKDLNLFFEGLGYWSPQHINASYDKDGLLEFQQDAKTLDALLASGVLDARVKYHITMMMDEGREYSQVINDVIRQFQVEYKAMIAQYPELFPSLFQTQEARDGAMARMATEVSGRRAAVSLKRPKEVLKPKSGTKPTLTLKKKMSTGQRGNRD